MKLRYFDYIRQDELRDETYPHWSRRTEYPLVLDELDWLSTYDMGCPNPKIHNTSWGFDVEHHQRFKNLLEEEYGVENVDNSDIKPSNIPNTFVLDITNSVACAPFKDSYDFVLNISAVEEIPGDHFKILKNLYSMVRPGGYLICTFDVPGLNIPNWEKYLTHPNEDVPPIQTDGSQWGGAKELKVLIAIVQKT